MTIVSTPDTSVTPSPVVRKARKNDRQPRRVVDANGEPTVQVTLKGGIIATLDGPDFDRMMGLGISHQWCRLGDGKGHSYAGVSGNGYPGNLLMVARLILDAPRGQVIRYADHNPMNLRRSNLVLATGFSKQREAGVKAGQDTGAEW